jgi:hypothetical protein
MYLRSKFIESSSFEKLFKDISHLNFSFFFDHIPSEEEIHLNPINIIAHAEPNEYFGHHDWIVKNHKAFNFILTWSDKVLNNCENAILTPFGSTWLKPEQYEKEYPKVFQVSHVRGNLLKTYGHTLRFEYHDRVKNEIQIPNKSWEIAGIREQIETCAVAKCELFGDAQFGVCIENTSHRNYYTEKIMEMFLFKTIPIYWGCSNIGDFFNMDGIITFENVDDAIHKINQLDENYYNSKKSAIEENYKLAQKYICYEQNVVDKITEIFKLNELI